MKLRALLSVTLLCRLASGEQVVLNDDANDSEWTVFPHPIKRVAVIGAGPSGLAALKIIKDSPQFKEGLWTATAFEARDKVGGIW